MYNTVVTSQGVDRKACLLNTSRRMSASFRRTRSRLPGRLIGFSAFRANSSPSASGVAARPAADYRERDAVRAGSGKDTSRIDISNTTPLPAKIYANEGIAQVLFKADEVCQVSQPRQGGKSQAQRGVTLPKI